MRGNGLAKDTLWSLVQEAANVLSLLVSFSLLGRHLGIEGYGHYASLYAIVSPTPHSLEKFASIDAPDRSGVASSRPSSDHDPALM